MAITQKRVFAVRDLNIYYGDAAAAVLGGVSSVGTYVDSLRKMEAGYEPGRQGPVAADHGLLTQRARLTTLDVLKVLGLLRAAPAAEASRKWEWFGIESGKATFCKGTLTGPIFHALNLRVSATDYATATMDAVCRPTANDDTLEDLLKIEGATAACLNSPLLAAGRVGRLVSCTYNAQAILHVKDAQVNIAAQVLVRGGDADNVAVGVDVYDFWPITFTLNFDDADEHSTTDADIRAYILANPGKNLVLTFASVAETAAQKLTILNVMPAGGDREDGIGDTVLTATGRAVYKATTTPFTESTLAQVVAFSAA